MIFDNETHRRGRRFEGELKDKLLDMMAMELINDPDAPDFAKTQMRLVIEAKNFEKKLRAFVIDAAEKINFTSSAEEIQKAQDITEYIHLMSAGFDSFVEVWKNEQVQGM